MLRKASTLYDRELYTKDNQEIGSIHDFYFSEEDWTVRYAVVDIGAWLFDRRVLVSTSAFGTPSWDAETVPVDLTKEAVKESPEIELARPVTRRQEAQLADHFGWPAYWATPMLVATGGMAPAVIPTATSLDTPPADIPDELAEGLRNAEESHIFSMRETKGYKIEATDDNIGHVSDFFIDEADWVVRYLLVDTGNWLPGKKVLISPAWVKAVDWVDERVYITATKEQVKQSPEYDPRAPLQRSYEQELHRHYGFPQYW